MRIFHWITVFAMLAAASGCGSAQTTGASGDSAAEFHGFVDQGLPPAQAAREQALFNVLEDARAGFRPEDIKTRGSSIDFRETSSGFLGGGGKLQRWRFDGAPRGDSVGVVLFVSSAPNGQVKEIHRTYRVTQQRGKFTITRA